jgi:hypothetical protein
MENFLRKLQRQKPHARNPHLSGIPNRNVLNGASTGLTYEEALTYPNSYTSQSKRSPYAKHNANQNERRVVLRGSAYKRKKQSKPKFISPGSKPKAYFL